MTTLRHDVTIIRLPLAAAFEMRGREDGLRDGVAAAGLPWPPSMHSEEDDGAGSRLIRLGPTRLLLRAAITDEAALETLLEAAFASIATADVLRVSDALVGFSVTGPAAVDVLAQGAPLDLSDAAFPPARATGTELWGVTVLVIREPAPQAGFTLLIDSAFADYLDEWLAVASGAEPRLRPGVMSRPPPSLTP
jgi:sarcosine oxidase subunit gamma